MHTIGGPIPHSLAGWRNNFKRDHQLAAAGMIGAPFSML
jgi:hypothetical protein